MLEWNSFLFLRVFVAEALTHVLAVTLFQPPHKQTAAPVSSEVHTGLKSDQARPVGARPLRKYSDLEPQTGK